MFHRGIRLPRGGYVSALASEGDIHMYIGNGGAFYSCTVIDYNGEVEVMPPVLHSYCEAVCPLHGGGRAERRSNIIKIRYQT